MAVVSELLIFICVQSHKSWLTFKQTVSNMDKVLQGSVFVAFILFGTALFIKFSQNFTCGNHSVLVNVTYLSF